MFLLQLIIFDLMLLFSDNNIFREELESPKSSVFIFLGYLGISKSSAFLLSFSLEILARSGMMNFLFVGLSLNFLVSWSSSTDGKGNLGTRKHLYWSHTDFNTYLWTNFANLSSLTLCKFFFSIICFQFEVSLLLNNLTWKYWNCISYTNLFSGFFKMNCSTGLVLRI